MINTRIGAAIKSPRSIIFYAWAGVVFQALLVVGVVIFVLVGAAYQRSATVDLHQTVQAMQIANLTARGDFLDAQRAARGYQATKQDRFLQTYYNDQDQFVVSLRMLRGLAWPAVLGGVRMQAASALAAFQAGDRAVAAAPGSSTASRLYSSASASADRFTGQSAALQQRLTTESDALASMSERILGVGLPVSSAVLAGLMLPIVVIALGLRWTSRPLHGVTGMVRRRAMGDIEVRVLPGGPADVRELAASINFLADEADRLMSIERERSRLQREVRQASTRIREHLRAGDVIREAVTAIKEHLWADFVWAGLASGDSLRVTDGDSSQWEQVSDITSPLPREAVEWLRGAYHQRSSYCIQDLNSGEAEKVPASLRKLLLGMGGASLLVTPFGSGSKLLGDIALMRADLRRPWTPAEIGAAEALAADIGRGLEHAHLYESEERLVAELQSLDQAKASFIASSSHDVRTPLASIVGYVEMLADGEAGPVSPDQAKMLDAVARNARRLQALIEDMLTLSKIELGAFTSSLRPVELIGLLRDSVTVIRPIAIEKGLAFELTCPDGGLVVDADVDQLDRVIINLLSNAVKYTAHGRVTMSAVREGDWAVLTITDTGMGIPEPDQQSLFTRFFRASNAVERAIPGSGLGLSITRTIIENHHGDIRFESAEGRGTTFTVRIPVHANGSVEQSGMPPAAARPLDEPPDHRPRPDGAQPDRARPEGALR
jgi:two-component system, OmpR family, phosphate regulon sensor histidine kinase PhoR